MKLPFLNCELEVGSHQYLTTELRDSNDIRDDAEALRSRMGEAGHCD